MVSLAFIVVLAAAALTAVGVGFRQRWAAAPHLVVPRWGKDEREKNGSVEDWKAVAARVSLSLAPPGKTLAWSVAGATGIMAVVFVIVFAWSLAGVAWTGKQP